MKKKVYRVRTQYVFEGVFDVVAESKEDARQKVLQNCGLVEKPLYFDPFGQTGLLTLAIK